MAFLILLFPQALLADDTCRAASTGDCPTSLLQLKLNERKEHVHKSVATDGASHREARARAALDATFWWKSSSSPEEHAEDLDSTTKGKGSVPDKPEGNEGNETISDEGNETTSDEDEGKSEGESESEGEGEGEETKAAEGEDEAEVEESGEETEEEKDAYLEEMEHAKAEDEAEEKIEEEKEAERHEEELQTAEDNAKMDEVTTDEPASEIETAHEEHEAEVDEESTSNAESATAHTAEATEELQSESGSEEHKETEHQTEDDSATSEKKEDLVMMTAHGDKVPVGSNARRSRGSKNMHADEPIRRVPVGKGPNQDAKAKKDGPSTRISGPP